MEMFSRRTGLTTALTIAAVFLAAAAPSFAAETEEQRTVITVGEMCGGCVKKINKRFEGLKGIAVVRCSIEHQTVTLVPEKGFRLSPRGVWEAMEGIGKPPQKMVCPAGTFTSKPPAPAAPPA